jgi:hypothetical protein
MSIDDKYEEYYQEQLRRGEEYQDFVVGLLCREKGLAVTQFRSKRRQYQDGETPSGIEIKLDDIRRTTGNLYIEYGEKRHPRPGSYAPAGIHRTTWIYAIGDYRILYLLPVSQLLAAKDMTLANGRLKYRRVENQFKTSEGYLLPCRDACKIGCVVPVSRDRTMGKVRDDTAKLAGELAAQLLKEMLRDKDQGFFPFDAELS